MNETKITQESEGLVVVRRVDWRSEFGSRRPNAYSLSRALIPYEEIARRYQGIDGVAWPNRICDGSVSLENGLAPLAMLDSVLRYEAALPKETDTRILYCRRMDQVGVSQSPPEHFRFGGFDVGLWFNEHTIGGFTFSSIYHEVLFGSIDRLRAWGTRLNEKLLFTYFEDASEYLRLREQMWASGQDVEESTEDAPMTSIEVYTMVE